MATARPHARGLYPDLRGPAAQRRRRRRWLVEEYGDGTYVRCWWCPTVLTVDTLEVDRYPTCGHDGGTYRRTNIVPSCRPCNRTRCSACLAGPEKQRPWRRWSDAPEEVA